MDYDKLQQAQVFKGLTIDEIEIILGTVPYKVRKFRAGSLLAQQGDQVNSFIIVMSGLVKGEMVDFAGRVIKIEDIPASGALASAFIFGNRNRFPVNVIAQSDGELLVIEKNAFLSLLMRNDRILTNFLDLISNRSQFLSEKIKFLNFKTIKGKLAHYILQSAGSSGNSVTFGMTQSELADYFGVARPSIARALGDMEEEGIIEASGKHIKIVNRKKLSDLIDD
ncbi:MAG TPA: Crp/Fnr family transcriptional regulator [Bacteroidales bacterium]|nr:Crp/Fnr family transcriptional regulator [Bacteroidales bacterium]